MMSIMRTVRILSIIAASSMLFSCAVNETSLSPAERPDSTVSFVMSEPESFTDSLVTKTYQDAEGNFVWSQIDTIGIIPDTGSPIYFSAKDDAGKSSINFTGGAWKLIPNTAYNAFYPFKADMYMNAEEIPYSIEGQSQAQNGVRVHDFYDCQYAKGTTNEFGGVLFEFQRLCDFMKVAVKPGAGTYTRLVLSAEEAIIPVEGTYDITAESVAIVPTRYADEISMSLGDITVGADETLTLYMALIPANWTGKQITVTLYDSNNDAVSYTRAPSKAWTANTTYGFSDSNLTEVPDAAFLCESAYGMYDLSKSPVDDICVLEAGKDQYSLMHRFDEKVFKVMNPVSGKFISMTFCESGSEDVDWTVTVYAPSIYTSSTKEYNLVCLKEEDGIMWLKDESADVGFIVKLED